MENFNTSCIIKTLSLEPEPPSLFLILNFIAVPAIMGILSLLVLLFLSGLMSGSEVAFFSLKKKDLESAKEDDSKITLVQKLLRNKKKLLATILVANNFINIGIVLLSAYLSEMLIHPYIEDITILGLNFTVLFDVVIITFILLLFGEIIPKIYSAKNPLAFSKLTANAINMASYLVQPISLPMMRLSNLIENNLKGGQTISVDQLSQALELTSEDVTTTSDEQKILEGIVNFGNTETSQIMTPRVDMFSIKLKLDFAQVVSQISSKGFSRIPVYDENIDEIQGVLYAKDLLPFVNKDIHDWQSLIRKPFFVPENKKLDDLLADFQERKIHIAIVVDEYGGTCGVVTLEDVLEEVVGDISDEFDDDEILYSKLDNYNYLFEGKTSLKDFYRLMEVNEDEALFEENKGEAETLAGFVLEITEETPNRRQTIHFENYIFTIESIDKRRIKRIKVTRVIEPQNDPIDED